MLIIGALDLTETSDDSFQLAERVAFTGGSGGIGLGMAKGFASSGVAVVIGGRNQT
jgi:short-subunit dehydrogenase